VDVSPDLRNATVWFAKLGTHDRRRPTRWPRPRRTAAMLGRQVRLKYLPRLQFREDPAIETGQRVEEILRGLHEERGDAGRRVGRSMGVKSENAGGFDQRCSSAPPRRSPTRARSRSRATSTLMATHSVRCLALSCAALDRVRCHRVLPDAVRHRPHYRELPGLDLITEPGEFAVEPDVMLTFDCGSLGRLGDLEPAAKAAHELIVIDHHISNDRYGTINLVEPDAAASG